MTNPLDNKKSDSLKHTLELEPSTPLWQRVPTRDDAGKSFLDFQIIIPKLKVAAPDYQKKTLDTLSAVLIRYQDTVVFADLNLKMNLLWVSIKPVKGMIWEIINAILESVPEAKLISDRPPTGT